LNQEKSILNQLEKILPLVEKPGRYVGGEYNSVVNIGMKFQRR
jgi:hypothetical protein